MGKQFHLTGNLTTVTALAVAFSLFTLWLIDSWIKYPLFLFEIFTIILLYLIIDKYEIKVKVSFPCNAQLNWGLIIDSLLVSSSAILILLIFMHINGGVIQVVLALLCTSLLPGYALLNVSGLIRHFTRLEGILFSYIFSYIYTGLLVLVLLPIDESLRETTILLSYIVLGMVSALKHWRHPLTFTKDSFARRIDILALLLSTAFYAISFYFIYPGFALLPGTDISQHYANSIVLWRTPELYSAFPYFLAHLHESAFIILSNAPLTVVQTTLVLLNLTMPIAFYIMAKNYMEGIDARLPAISTIFYSTFSGFAWIYLARLKLEGVQGSTLSILGMVNDKAFNGAMYLAQPFLWYVPLSTSFTILMVQFALLRKLKVNRRSFIALFALSTVASYLTHVTEAVIFSVFLCVYAFFSKSKDIRLDDAIIASIIGFLSLNSFYIGLQYLMGKPLGFSIILSLIAPTAILIFVYFYRKSSIQVKLAKSLSKLISEPLIKVVLYIVAYVYVLGLVVWISGVPSFHTWAINEIAPILWFQYPVFLGVIGILTIATLYYLLENVEAKRLLMPFIILIIFSFIFGKMMSFININFFWISYREGRLSSYYLLASTVLAPIALVKALEGFKKRDSMLKTAISALLISIIVLYGVQSSFMVVEYWSSRTDPSNLPAKEEFEALNILKKLYQNNPYAFGLTLASGGMLTFAAPPYIDPIPQAFYTARNPEMPLTSLKAHNLSHPYLYMAKRDFQLLNWHRDSWLCRHLLPMLPVVYRNNEVTVYNASSISFPQGNSTTALLIPFDESLDPEETWLYAYDMLSLGEYDYTVVYDLDPKVFSYETLILPVDLPKGNILQRSFEDNFTKWTVVSGTWVYKTDGLHAGKLGEYEYAVILSPASGQNFTASLSFKPLDGDLKVANYISIVYDWRDKDNFKYAGLMFSSSSVYAYIGSCENGNKTQYPPWPGLNTGLKWHWGDSFNLTVSINRDSATLWINGTDYLTAKSIANGGRIGISMDRFYHVLFTKFKVETFSLIQGRNPAEYLGYVQNGGNLIVLNTNGYGYFADAMLKVNGSAIEVDTIISDSEKIMLPAKLTVPKLLPKTGDAETIAYYRAQQNISIYAVREKAGSGMVTYVNVYPIMEAIKQAENKSVFYEIIGKLLSYTGIRLRPFQYMFASTTVFRQVKMSGDIEVNAQSVLFPLSLNLRKVEITYDNNSLVSILDVTGIKIMNCGNVLIEASDLTLCNGRGFYCTLTFEGKVAIRFEDNSASIILSTVKGNVTRISDVNRITIGSDYGSVMLYARQPSIRLRGMASFKELYSSGAIYQRTLTLGQNLNINGTVELNIYLSDVYTWASSLDASGFLQRSPPLLQYDELTSLPQALSWSLILTLIFLALAFIRKEKNGG
jgi:hypothetical protein